MRTSTFISFLLAASSAAVHAADPAAPSLTLVSRTEESAGGGDMYLPRWARDFSGSGLSVGSNVGTGTFVLNNPYAANAYVSTGVSLSPRYRLTPRQSLSLSWSFDFEHTSPDNSEGRRFSPSDLGLGYAFSNLATIPGVGVGVSASGRVTFPTSPAARYNGTIVNLAAGLSLYRAFFSDKLSFGFASRFTKYLPRSPTRGLTADSPIVDGKPAEGSTPNLSSAYCRDGENFCTGGPLNANYGFSNSLSVTFAPIKRLSFGASFGITNTFVFEVPELYSDPSLPRGGRRDSTRAGLSAGFDFNDHLGLSLAVDTAQSPLTADNQRLRFPFYDFTTPANNHTVWSLSVQARL